MEAILLILLHREDVYQREKAIVGEWSEAGLHKPLLLDIKVYLIRGDKSMHILTSGIWNLSNIVDI